MRQVLVVLLVALAAACRRDPVPEASEALPVAEAPPAPDDPPSLAASEIAPEAPAAPAPAAVPVAAQGEPASSAAPAEGPPTDAADVDEGAIHSWTDAQGVIHYGRADEVPDDRRASARKVGGGLTVVEAAPVALPASAAPGEPAPVTQPGDAGKPVRAPREPGDAPELDAEGLPVPGTMKDTAHTRAVRQATGVQLDPAAVERQYRQQLRDMKCVEKDGVVTCG